MPLPPISINISAPKASNFIPMSPSPFPSHPASLYTTTGTNEPSSPKTLLYPRYADADSSSAPPSPASMESFDILDAGGAWRRGGGGMDGEGYDSRARAKRWRKTWWIVLFLILGALVLGGGLLGAGFGEKWKGNNGNSADGMSREEVRRECERRGGGEEKCSSDVEWAGCVVRSGVGYCEGVLGGS
ncbi:hypothetical protein B0J11DRAFT_505751 [Dendryphion nanum]|uniref:Uncharacterized protein n=1 Tax=Dendryphion nanum TaxID=256645 RepID=A0A9P9IQ01_9PLEO|nr:hypothetical protein B0J11DRAFT_505751 [Dendryphion nanum]